MRPRLFASAAAALSAALVAAADPLPLPVQKPAAAVPALPAVPNTKPILPGFLPETQEKSEQPKPLPVVPQPRMPDVPPGTEAPAPAAESCDPMPTMPRDTSIHDDHLGPWNAVWVRGGYSYLWIKDAPAAPTLLATGTGAGSRTLLGGTNTDFGAFSAISFDGGVWLNERHTVGLGLAGFLAEKRSTVSSFSSDAGGSPGFVRPFFNAQIGGANANDSFLVADPGRYAGSFAVEQGARIDGFEVYGILNLCNTEAWTANVNLGFRYFDLDEYLTTYQVTQGLNGNTIPFFGQGTVGGVAITDRFRTRNQMYAPQMGGDTEYRFGPMFLDLGLKAALGPVHQVTDVFGQTEVPGGASGPGGILAVAPPGGPIRNGNIGRNSTDNFAVLTDVNGLLGLQVSSHFRIGVGYQFLYLNNVARPSNQIVTTVDPRIVPVSLSYGGRTPSNTALGGVGTPPFTPFDRDDFFVHGLRFLVEVQY